MVAGRSREILQVFDQLLFQLGGGHGKSVFLNLRQVREEAEIQAIKRALVFSDNKVAQAAELLGVSRPTLYDLMDKHGLKG